MNSSPESTPPVAPEATNRSASAPAVTIDIRVTRRWMIALVAGLIVVMIGAVAGGVRAVSGMRDASQTQEQLAAIHGELIRIRQILETDPDSDDDDAQVQRTARLSISGAPILGSPNAPLTLVEFTDFQCPFCSRFHSDTFPALRKAQIDTGHMRYITVDFPLTGIHPDAYRAARASHCAEDQGRYWDLHEALFRQRGRLGRDALVSLASGLRMNAARFTACLDSDANDGRIEQGISKGRSIGVSGTPTFLLGKTVGSSVVGQVIVGAQPYEVFDEAIRALLDRT